MEDLSQLARPCVQNIPDYIPGKPIEEVRREMGLSNIIKLSSNENPLGGSPRAYEAIVKELINNIHYYPEGQCPDLIKRLAQRHNLTPEHFLVENGADGAINLLGLAFINPGEEVVTGEHTFMAYAIITARMDGKFVPVKDSPPYHFNIDGLIAAVTSKTKMLFLCNPNNPTGTFTRRADFEKLLRSVPKNVLIVADEAYYEFSNDPDYPQSVNYLNDHPNLIILRTFSKIMGLASVRVGYAIAHPQIIKLMMKVRDPFPVNRAAQAGALAAIDDEDFIRRSQQIVYEGREQYYRAFEALGISYCKSLGNFVFIDLEQPAHPIFETMLKDGIIIRPLGGFKMPNCLRITIGTREQNEQTIASLAKALGRADKI